MNTYLFSELWGGLLDDDREVKGKNIAEAKKNYLLKKGWHKTKQMVYDSKRNMDKSTRFIVAVQEGHYDSNINRTYIRGKRYFYKVIDKQKQKI